MSRPTKHRKTGVYWFRKRVPSDIAVLTGRREVNKTLGTKDPEEAKRKYPEVLAEFEHEWAQLRLGNRSVTGSGLGRPAAGGVDALTPRLITDREAHVDKPAARTSVPLAVVSAGSGCNIKGSISARGERTYHVPGQNYYDAAGINERAGERWFCSEAEARASGWRRSKR